MKVFLIVILVSILSACSSIQSKNNVRQTVQRYFDVYSERKDFDRLMEFYAEEATLKDIVYGNDLKNKDEIRAFLDWNKGEFELLKNGSILNVTKQTVEGSSVITEGYFYRFIFNQQTLGPWLFVIIHELDKNNRIISQTDWINYTPRKSFLGGIDMNQNELK